MVYTFTAIITQMLYKCTATTAQMVNLYINCFHNLHVKSTVYCIGSNKNHGMWVILQGLLDHVYIYKQVDCTCRALPHRAPAFDLMPLLICLRCVVLSSNESGYAYPVHKYSWVGNKRVVTNILFSPALEGSFRSGWQCLSVLSGVFRHFKASL